MRRDLLIVITAVDLVLSVPLSYAWELKIEEQLGGICYEEEEISVKSEWSGFFDRIILSAGDYDNKDLEGDLHYGFLMTSTYEESWDINGTRYQTNDMRLWGMDAGAQIGWAFAYPLRQDGEIAITPLIGYRWKFYRFTRENFVILNAITIRQTVDEDFNLHLLDLGGRLSCKIGTKTEIFAKPVFGIMLYGDADNSALGSIKGDGGFTFGLDTGLNYFITGNLAVGIAFVMELQRLQGGESGIVIWPDNSLDTYGGSISLTYQF